MLVSIVIPTYNEQDNVRTMASRIASAFSTLPALQYEIWFMDDSVDATPTVLEELAQSDAHVHYVHRTGVRGLGHAVVEGFSMAKGDYLIVMDADLQHPPELLPTIVTRLHEGMELVIPSRFVPGGSDGGLNLRRKLISWIARTIGRLALSPLRHITDCTGGYFGLHRSVVREVQLNPIGWKILIEVLVKGNYKSVHEVPYAFLEREVGLSKMSVREQLRFLQHITTLVRQSPDDRRFYIFCLVGALGTILNLVVMSGLLHYTALHGLIASVFASLIAMLHNFIWHRTVTWRSRKDTARLHSGWQAPLFVVISCVGIAITALFVHIFVLLHTSILLGQLMGIVVATVWNYVANNRWTWSVQKSEYKVSAARRIRVTQEPTSH